MPYLASDTRYNSMPYNRVGRSGLKIPAISLGWWYNFGGIVFSPLAQGQLTDRYLNGIPSDARASKTVRVWLTPGDVQKNLPKIKKLNDLAKQRGQSLAQMALAWVLRKPAVTSALIGASSVTQLEDNLAALNNLDFAQHELDQIEAILKG